MSELNFKDKMILAIGAHPDDSDFSCGGTIAKAAAAGARAVYLIATTGQRGSSDEKFSPDQLSKARMEEQRRAAEVIGVSQVIFLDYLDGELRPDLELKEKLVVYIRKYRPDIVFTMDPSFYYYKDQGFINHSDHRAIGEAAIDACYPLARDLLSFPEHQAMGLKPHKVKELFLHSFNPEQANCLIDVSQTFALKLKAISLHKSQVGDMKAIERRIRARAESAGKLIRATYAEAFIRLELSE